MIGNLFSVFSFLLPCFAFISSILTDNKSHGGALNRHVVSSKSKILFYCFCSSFYSTVSPQIRPISSSLAWLTSYNELQMLPSLKSPIFLVVVSTRSFESFQVSLEPCFKAWSLERAWFRGWIWSSDFGCSLLQLQITLYSAFREYKSVFRDSDVTHTYQPELPFE